MSILLILSFSSFFLIVGKKLFGKVLNPVGLYTLVWGGLLSIYELKLIKYYDLTLTTWATVILAFLGVFFGSVTVLAARADFGKVNGLFYRKEKIEILAFKDGGKTILAFILIFSMAGLLAAIQQWIILIREFGSVAMVLIKSAVVYKMRVSGELKGSVPYVFSLTYTAIFLSALYAGYYNKFKPIMILPFIALVIQALAAVARAGMLFGIIVFFLTYVLMRYLRSKDSADNTKIQRKKIVISFIVIFSLIITAASLVKTFRAANEKYKASTRTLKELEDGFLISPSIYLYASAHVGVLNAYLKTQDEKTMFGENTFLPLYRFLSKFGAVETPSYYQRGYFIPIWTNTGTYLREIHADFGPVGLFLIPFLLGLFSTFFWFRFFEKNKLSDLAWLLSFLLIIMFSFLVMVTRLAFWEISLILNLVTVGVLEKIVAFSLRLKSLKKLRVVAANE